jgi:hypothetical protein
MIVKFNPASKPSYVDQDLLLDDPVHGQVIGYRMTINGNDIRITAGDFIHVESSGYSIIKATDYAGSDFVKNEVHELIGKHVVRDLYRTLRSQNLTQAQEGDILNRVFPVFCALGDGFIRGAREMANNLAVAGQLTAGRKNYLIAKIDEAIQMI